MFRSYHHVHPLW